MEVIASGEPTLRSAQRALAAGHWTEAREQFAAVARRGDADAPAAHEGLAQVAWWCDDSETCLSEREAAYRLYRGDGNALGAARAATSLAWDAVLFGQGASVARGWWALASGLLRDLPESPEHGWLAIREAELAQEVDHDPIRARSAGERASAIGRRLGDADLEAAGSGLSGLAMIEAGDVAAGMDRLDAAVAAATAGDVADLMWMGKICCWLIAACTATQDVERAADWCRRVEEICVRRGLSPLFEVCRIQYAGMQLLKGDWTDAERELASAVERLAGSRRETRRAAIVQLGELRRRQGRLDEAEALLREVEFEPAAAVSLALISAARGRVDVAADALHRLLDHISPANALARVAVLPALVTVAIAAGRPHAARAAADEVRTIAQSVGTGRLLGLSAVADAALVRGPESADRLRDAVRHFRGAGLDFDEAQARLALAEGVAEDDPDEARGQVASAVTLLTTLRATPELARASAIEARLHRTWVGAHDGPLTHRQAEVLALVAGGLSNDDIARQLQLSRHTVHRHVANILTVLGVGSRTAAAAYAVGRGWVPTS